MKTDKAFTTAPKPKSPKKRSRIYLLVINQWFVLLLALTMTPAVWGENINPGKKDTSIQIIQTNYQGKGIEFCIQFTKGKAHNHPLMAVWIEDINGNYIQTLYVAKSIANGIFEHGSSKTGKWLPGERRRPAALPYWSFKRGIRENDGLYVPTPSTPVPDAYTGATPSGNFRLNTRSDNILGTPFRLMFEINQSFDWNDYWYNNKFPDDADYKTSAQPSLVYSVIIDPKSQDNEYWMNPAGHGHYSGKDGKLYTDLSTFTTALQIVKSIKVTIKQK